MLRVGEATGGVPVILQQLTDNLQRRKAVGDKVRRALVYQAISLAVALVAAVILVTYSLPSLTGLLKDYGGELPIATRLLINISDVLQAYIFHILGPVAVLVLLVLLGSRSARVRRLRDRALLSFPVVGGILLASNMFSLTTTLSTLLRSGVPPIEALKSTEEGLGNAVMRERLAEVTRRASEGTKLGDAFAEHQGFPSILAQAVSTGEMRGSLSDSLGGLAEYYEDVTERSVSGATELIQPAVIIGVAAVVGFVAIAVISGIYSTLGSFQ